MYLYEKLTLSTGMKSRKLAFFKKRFYKRHLLINNDNISHTFMLTLFIDTTDILNKSGVPTFEESCHVNLQTPDCNSYYSGCIITTRVASQFPSAPLFLDPHTLINQNYQRLLGCPRRWRRRCLAHICRCPSYYVQIINSPLFANHPSMRCQPLNQQ